MIGKTILHYKNHRKTPFDVAQGRRRGGMGVVYKAEDAKLERTVAIKFRPRHISSNEEERRCFEIEAKAAAALNHPNIATVYAIEEHDDEMFIVMEYIEGRELKNLAKVKTFVERLQRPIPDKDQVVGSRYIENRSFRANPMGALAMTGCRFASLAKRLLT